MNFCFRALLAVVVLVAGGCATQPVPAGKFSAETDTPESSAGPGTAAESKTAVTPKLIVTPEAILVGVVATYNTAGRFVVVDFPVGRMPALDQVLFVYRQGLKVGEIKIVGPERDHMTVADLIAGEARKGDEVRDR